MTTPQAKLAGGQRLDLDAITDEWLRECGPCDAGLPMECTHPDKDYRPVMAQLVTELAELRQHYDDTQRVLTDAFTERDTVRADERRRTAGRIITRCNEIEHWLTTEIVTDDGFAERIGMSVVKGMYTLADEIGSSDDQQ